MSGIAVAQELRKDGATKSMILVALTAADVKNAEPELKTSGFDFVISKPLT